MASDATVHFPRSSVLSGEGLFGSAGEKILLNQAVDEIHNENVAKLESMTQDEILEEQARIKASLGKTANIRVYFFGTYCKPKNCKGV